MSQSPEHLNPDRLSPQQPSPGETTVTAGYQNWRTLTFLHWRVDPVILQRLLPPGLSIEERDGHAWLGVVLFAMERVRPWWSPAVPGVSWFLETNVRTYVRHESGMSGVWFFSLDANARLAVNIARTFWHLPYKYSTMMLERRASRPMSGSAAESETIRYSARRREQPSGDYDVVVNISNSSPSSVSRSGSLDEFLIERYLLVASDARQRLYFGRVHHSPYQWQPVTVTQCRQSLTAAMGVPIVPDRPADHAAFSEGVDVRVSPLIRM